MRFLKWLFGEKTNEASGAASEQQYVRSCLEFDFVELEDKRVASYFDEITEIRHLLDGGDKEAALDVAQKGINEYPDSFIFYYKTGSILESIGRQTEAKKWYLKGLQNSLRKMDLCESLGDIGMDRKDYRMAIMWYIRACVLQVDSNIFREPIPFLILAHVAKDLGIRNAHEYLSGMADTISYQLYGQPIHFTPERVGYTAKVGDWVRKKNDEGIPLAIDALCKYEPSDKGSRPPHEDTDNMSTSSIDDDIRPEVESLIVLLEKLQNWRSLPFHEVSPLMTSVEEIGETLYESGGVDAMERAYSSIAVRDADLSSQLDTFWEGIGKWKQ